MFETLFARLSDRYHLIAPDYPGFGHSDWPDPKKFAYTFDHFAEIMDHFTEALRISRYTLCAGINRHVVGNERVLQERRKRIHLGPESCGGHRERSVEA